MYWDDKYGTETVSGEVLAQMKQQMVEDTNSNSANTSFLLDDDPSVPCGFRPRDRLQVFLADLVWGRGPGARGGGPGAVRWRMGAGAGPMEISRVVPRVGPGLPPARPPQPGEFPRQSDATLRASG